MKSRPWTFLRKGDIVDVVAPGYASTPDQVEGARRFLISWGLVPRIPPALIAPHFLHANEDAERFRFLKAALTAPDSAAVWCLRGGYGSNRLLPMLSKVKRPTRTKLFVGISDVTSLHVFLSQEWGWSTLHGPLMDRLGRGLVKPKHEKEVHRLVFGEANDIVFKALKPLNEAARTSKTVRGEIIGGNLVTMQSTLGTPWQIRTKGKFLFVEELGERGYRIDRIFEHLRQSGALKGCLGLLLGDFLGGREEDGRNLIPAVLQRAAREFAIPVYSGLEAGHAAIQRPVPFGSAAVLTRSGSTGLLKISSGGVER